jgi:hypothetical protein
MANINLLPEDLRRREEKEVARAAKRPKIFEIPLYQPAKEPRAELSVSKPRRSWWERIFGIAKKPQMVAGRIMPKPTFNSPAAQPSFSATSREVFNKPAPVKSGVAAKRKWFKLFGPARWPMKTTDSWSQPAAVKFSATPPPVAKPVVSFKPLKVKFSWWRWLLGFDQTHKVTAMPEVKAPQWPAWPQAKSASNFMEENKNFKPRPTANWLPPIKAKVAGEKKSWSFWRFWRPRPKVRKAELVPASSAPVAVAKGKYSAVPKREKSLLNINLMPEELMAIRYYSGGWQLAIVVAAIIGPAAIIYGLYFVLSIQERLLDKKIAVQVAAAKEIKNQLDSFQGQYQRSLGLQKKLLVLNDLMEQRKYWSKFFMLLEKYTIDEVYFTDFTADISGEFVLPAVAKDYAAAARQIMVLKQAKDFVEEVRVDSIKLRINERAGIDGVSFKLKLKLVDGIFSKS